jgi:lipoprotein NlpD
MKKVRLVFLLILPALITACSTPQRSAPVIDRASGIKGGEVSRTVPGAASQAPKQADGRGYYTVKRGDTLIQIALEFGQNYRDLVAWNDLANPNDLKVDQVIRVLPPEGGAQTGSIATTTGVEVRPLSSPASPTSAQGANKTMPRGDKRPYSEGALAELQKPDASHSAPAAGTAKTEPPKVADTKPAGKAAEAPGTDDENISWIWPAEGKVVTNFSDGKKGIDIAGKLGQPVLAAGAGKVLYAGSGIRGYGNLVIVKHTNTLLSAYAHNKTIFVKEDQTVNQGQKIAEMGNSDSDAVKLHFEIRHQGKPVDPSKFLPSR